MQDKWVRESVVTAVLLFITFSGHLMFLMLTLPVFANKNFPYHVRTTQIGVMEVTNNNALDGFGPNAYHPTNGAAQTVIIPLTRRTEELIGNMYREYMATAPPMSLENTPKLNGIPKRLDSTSPRARLVQQDSTETNHSDDIRPSLSNAKEIFTVESQISKIEGNKKESKLPIKAMSLDEMLPVEKNNVSNGKNLVENGDGKKSDFPSIVRSRRALLEPIKRDVPVPSWSLAKGPCVVSMMRKTKNLGEEETPDPLATPYVNGKKVPPVRNGLNHSSGEISTIHEGREQNYVPSEATVNLFTAAALRNGLNT